MQTGFKIYWAALMSGGRVVNKLEPEERLSRSDLERLRRDRPRSLPVDWRPQRGRVWAFAGANDDQFLTDLRLSVEDRYAGWLLPNMT